MQAENVSARVRKTREALGLNPRQFALSVDLNPSNYYKVESGKLGVKTTSLQIISEKYGVSLQWLLTGEGEMFTTGHSGTVNEPPSPYVKAPNGRARRRPSGSNEVPFYEADFEAGGGVMFYEDIRTSTPAYTMDVPDFAGCTAFRTYGHSMEPLIASGAILFGTKDEQWRDFLEYGQIYGIVCHNGRRYLKQVRKSKKSETHLLLISENEAYDPFDLPMDVIKSMWLIHGWLNKNT